MLQQFTGQDVRMAYVRIADFIRRTPLEDSIYLNDEEHRYRFKLESQQLGKSFKIRGALNVLAQLPRDQIERGVGTISTGNHGIAVSYACKLLGIENCVVVVPFDTPKNKLDRIRFYGARVMQMGYNYDEALTLGLNYIDRHELFYVDPGDFDPRVYAGQGTIGYEIMVSHPKVDTIVAPMGSGGLITGIAVSAKAINPNVRIIGVQTAACPAVARSLADGIPFGCICLDFVYFVVEMGHQSLQSIGSDFRQINVVTVRQNVRLSFIIVFCEMSKLMRQNDEIPLSIERHGNERLTRFADVCCESSVLAVSFITDREEVLIDHLLA